MKKKFDRISFIIGILLLLYVVLPQIPQLLFQNKPSESQKQQDSSVAGVKTTGASEQKNVVTKVLDGDTIEVDGKQKVRYLGVNTPEKNQPYYKEALEKNKSLVLGKQVTLTPDVQKTDRYGRTLAYVYVDQTFVNEEMIRSGLAVVETIQPNVAQQDLFVTAQRDARAACAGIWSSLCSSTARCITITSINNPIGSDAKQLNNEWIQFRNTCQSSVSLTNWLLKDNSASNSYTFKAIEIGQNQTLTLHSGCSTDTTTDIYWTCPAQKNSVWNNEGDHAFLYNEKKELVADYQY